MASEIVSPGLENVVAAETVLSLADPATGAMWVRGRPLPDLVEQGYEATVALVWEGFIDHGLTPAGIKDLFGAARCTAFEQGRAWRPLMSGRPVDEGVRILLALLPDESAPAEIVAGLAVGVPAMLRIAAGKQPIAPDPTLSTAGDFLRMLHDRPASDTTAAALDTYFTVMLDSGLSPSTFTARTVASTRASAVSAVLAAWCAFTGPLHGGAPGPTLDLLDAAAVTDDLDAWLEQKLRAGERLMGFGHRVYRGNDPRAKAMREALTRMGSSASRLAFAMHLEECVARAVERTKPGRRLPANVEIMAALLLDAVGIPRDAFTAVFAVTRSAGWIAHAAEQRQRGRMIRPASKYVGPPVA
jgi:citrate synthase